RAEQETHFPARRGGRPAAGRPAGWGLTIMQVHFPARRGSRPAAGRPAGWGLAIMHSARLIDVEEGDLPVGQVPRRRGRELIVLGRPSSEVLRGVLVPRDALRHRADGYVLEHDLLDLLDEIVLLGRIVGGPVLVEQRVQRRILVPAVVARRR